MKSKAIQFLDRVNAQYLKLHKDYEEYFWISYMGDHSVDKKKDEAMMKRDSFRADPMYIEEITQLLKEATPEEQKRLNYWLRFFNCTQSPKEALPIKNKITKLETKILKKRSARKEGYIDPYTQKFVSASELKMGTMMGTHEDEKIRRACFEAKEKLAVNCLDEYIEMVGLRNQYAQILGYEDFYDYKVQREDGMTKKELFKIFDDIYEKTKYAKEHIKKMEKDMPGLRKPWNYGYMMSGDFTKEEDQYFQFDEALTRWGKTFAALGVDFKGSTIQLDLLDRKGKWNNGFCHWPDLVHFEKGKRMPGSSNFTCTAVLGEVGSGADGLNTLFHEGGHAAHMLNIEQQDVCVNHEYAPMSMSWAETHSMFMDSLLGDMEWRTRYALNDKGEPYSFELFERKVKKLNPMRPLILSGIMFVSNFEKEIYETKNLTPQKVTRIAKKVFTKYFERSQSSLRALNIPHIYSWESSGSYHGYGLAELAVAQWKDYFYKKYGYIVDNPQVGKEMTKVWELGSTKTFNEFVILATGKKLSSQAFLKDIIGTEKSRIANAKRKIEDLKKVKPYTGPIKLNVKINMLNGKEIIATNAKSFEDMADTYKAWLKKSEKALKKK